MRRFSHVVGVDDGPFPRERRGEVLVVGAVFAGDRLEGVLSTRVRKDGANATARLAEMIGDSRFAPQLHAVLLDGIALGGFNVVDLPALHARLGLPVLAVTRRPPNMDAVRRALLGRVPGGRRKWARVERAGPMEPCRGLWVQRAGLSPAEAEALVALHARYGNVPEPLRVAHLIAGGVGGGHSSGRA